ncbi:MAG: class I SAM-dependent methyltransferase [Bacteroidales bacterium]
MKPIDESIIESLDGSDIRLREYIPYLLQDIWEIGADPETMISMVKKHVDVSNPRILDLGCGKGAVSIRIAREVECNVLGIDAVPEFIIEAIEYARKFNVLEKCSFQVGDIRVRIKELSNFDIVIMGAIGLVLGNLEASLKAINQSLNTPGYVLLDDGYIKDEADVDYTRCLRKSEFYRQIKDSGFSIIHEEIFTRDGITESDTVIFNAINKRADELINKHPDKSGILKKYIDNQDFENKMLETTIITGTWLLRNYSA